MPRRPGGYDIRESDGDLLLTVYPPSDSAGRTTSASSLTIRLPAKQALQFKDDVVMACAGIGGEG